MKKIILLIIGLVLLLNLSLVSAVTQQELNEAKDLIDSKVSCDKLTNDQLEIIGEYYMEQMHPGESHEIMHKMMGLQEGSETEEQFHRNMAKTLYCDESGIMGYGMMGSVKNMMGGNMMGSGMMGGYGMMSGYGMMGNFGFGFFSIIYPILLIGITILVYVLIVKLLRNIGGKK